MAVKSFNARTGLSVGTTPVELFDTAGNLTLPAGTTTSTPLKFTSGTNLSSAVAGAVEWDGTNLFITQSSGPTRKTIAYTDSNITGSAASATNATNATNTAITDDTTTNATMYPTWVTAATGNLPQKVTSTKLSFNPSTGTLTATAFSGSGASLTSLTAGNLSGTIPSAVLGNSTVFIGTTAVALNRASASLALTGITSIDGNAATATTATTATNVGGGTAGALVYQTGAGATNFIAAVAAGSILASNGTSTVPVYTATPSITTSVTVPLIQGTGSTGGTLTLRGGTDTTGTVAINAATISSSVSSLTLLSGPTTVNAFGGATTLSLGAATGTTTVNNSLVVTGTLVVNGTTSTINTNTLTVDDKNIELGSVSAVNGVTGTSSVGSAVVTGMSTTQGLIPGMVTTVAAGTLTLAGGTTILSVDSPTQVTLSANFGGSGTSTTLNFAGASDSTANGGGITLKGASDKTIIWDSANSNWTSSENWNIATGKTYKVNNVTVLSATGLGSSVVSSSLTSVGTLTSLTTSGQITSTVSTGTAPFVVASTTQVANLNAATAGTATNLAGGGAGQIPYQSAAGTTAMLAAGTTSQVLVGGASAPSWSNTPTLTGTNFTGIPNSALNNSSVTIGSTAISLGASATTIVGLTSVTSTTFVGNLTGTASNVTTNANLTGPVTSVGNATSVTNNAITNAMLAQMATNTIKGNNTGGTANASDLTATQVTAMLDVFTSGLKGLVPASGGGTTNFLRADGTWTTPGGGGTVTAVSIATANGVSGSSSGGSTPALTIVLGDITPSSVAATGALSGTTVTAGSGTTTSNTFVSGSMYFERAGYLATSAVTLVNLDTWAVSTSRSARYTISAVDTVTGHSYFTEVLVTRDNSNNVFITEFGTLVTGTNIISLTADYDGSANVRLRITPASTNTTQTTFTAKIFRA